MVDALLSKISGEANSSADPTDMDGAKSSRGRCSLHFLTRAEPKVRKMGERPARVKLLHTALERGPLHVFTPPHFGLLLPPYSPKKVD